MPSQQNKNNYTYNKAFGLQSSSPGLELASEFTLNLPSHARQVHADLVRKDTIPTEVPLDLRLDSLAVSDPLYLPLSEELDDNGESLSGSLAGRTSSISSQVRRYCQVPLVGIGSSVNLRNTSSGTDEKQFQMYAGVRGPPPNANTPFTIQTSHPNVRFAPNTRCGFFLRASHIMNTGASTIHVDDTSDVMVGDKVRDLSGHLSYSNTYTIQSINSVQQTFVVASSSVTGTTGTISPNATIVVWRKTFRTVLITVEANNVIRLMPDGSGNAPSTLHMYGQDDPLETNDLVMEPVNKRDTNRVPYFDTWDPLRVKNIRNSDSFEVDCTETTISLSVNSQPFEVNLYYQSEGTPAVGGQDFSDVTTNQISNTTDPGGSYAVIIHKYNEQGVVSNVPSGAAGGDPQLDIDGGTLRFFKPKAESLRTITGKRPPSLSFYRYVGEFGVGGSAVLFDSARQAAASGSNGFDLKAIQIDSRNLSTIEENSQALQFGGDQMGAWRILIKSHVDGGCFPTVDSDTSFHIQTYKGGNWVDMQVIVQE